MSARNGELPVGLGTGKNRRIVYSLVELVGAG